MMKNKTWNKFERLSKRLIKMYEGYQKETPYHANEITYGDGEIIVRVGKDE